mgnify:CR=1 FL=1
MQRVCVSMMVASYGYETQNRDYVADREQASVCFRPAFVGIHAVKERHRTKIRKAVQTYCGSLDLNEKKLISDQ